MPQLPPLVDSRVTRPSESALALGMVTELELLRLKTLARWYGRGLPADVTWEDLLQETLTRILVGTRPVPEGVAIVAFVAGVMRSIRSEHWRRVERADPGQRRRSGRRLSAADHPSTLLDVAPGPDRALLAQQELAEIQKLFAGDATAASILEGLARGMTAEEIRLELGLSDTEYATARKRMRRILLREGLTCTPK